MRVRSTVVTSALLASLAACRPASYELTDAVRAAVRDTIDMAIAEWIDAARAVDADRIRAHYAPDVVAALDGVVLDDFDDRFAQTRAFLAGIRSIETGAWTDRHVEVLAPDAAVMTGTHRVVFVDTSGTEIPYHAAWTGVFRRLDGEWKVIYSHESTRRSEQG